MINPQMMGMHNFEKVPSPQDLWKNEKNRYRHWMILFGIGLLVILVLYLTASILNWFDKAKIDSFWTTEFQKDRNLSQDQISSFVSRKFVTDYILGPSLILGLVIIGLGLFIATLIKSYKKHSFANLSMWSTYSVGFGAFISIFQLIQAGIGGANFISVGTSFQFATFFIFIALFLTTSRRVSLIRRQFAYSEYVQKLKKDDRFMQMQQQMQGSMAGFNGQNFNPYTGTGATTQSQDNLSDNLSPSSETNIIITTPQAEQRAKLSSLDLIKIQEVARKLSVSGYESMSKEELIDTIIRITSKNS